ncbi:hypothetical protein [Fournierella sp.]|uniref:hypothetical protein n=1 Tax=Allofournierella sp. TaxID=1940256 RepID=UPI00307A972D
MEKNLYQALADMPAEERARFVGSRAVGVLNLEKLGIRKAAGLVDLCPATLSQKVLGRAAGCDELNRACGSCAQCTERFLRRECTNKVQFMKRSTEVR